LKTSLGTIGRLLRLLVGILFLGTAVTLPQWTLAYVVRVGSIFLALFHFYLLLGWVWSRGGIHPSPWIGALLSNGVVGLVMVLGTPNGLILGHGEGFIGAAAYVGISLLIAAWRADPGYEVTSLSALVWQRHNALPCLPFTPPDALEKKQQTHLLIGVLIATWFITACASSPDIETPRSTNTTIPTQPDTTSRPAIPAQQDDAPMSGKTVTVGFIVRGWT